MNETDEIRRPNAIVSGIARYPLRANIVMNEVDVEYFTHALKGALLGCRPALDSNFQSIKQFKSGKCGCKLIFA